jgi:hypothetical protein
MHRGKISLCGIDECQLFRKELVGVVGREAVKVQDRFFDAGACVVRNWDTSFGIFRSGSRRLGA